MLTFLLFLACSNNTETIENNYEEYDVTCFDVSKENTPVIFSGECYSYSLDCRIGSQCIFSCYYQKYPSQTITRGSMVCNATKT